jgi:hypothetical protein
LKFLVPAAVVLAAILIAEVSFILVSVQDFSVTPASGASNVGTTNSVGTALFTRYLLPFEITSILLLMAIVGAMTLARRGGLLSANARVIPGAQQLPLSLVDSSVGHEDTRAIETDTTDEAAQLLGYERVPEKSERE